LTYLQLRALVAMLLLNLEFKLTENFDATKFWNGVRIVDQLLSWSRSGFGSFIVKMSWL